MEAEGPLKARWCSHPCDASAITYASPRPDVARRNYSADTPRIDGRLGASVSRIQAAGSALAGP
jgi:hypothetical protein